MSSRYRNLLRPASRTHRQHVAITKHVNSHRSRLALTPMAPDAPALNGSSTPSAVKTPQKPSATPNVLEVVFGSLLIKPWYPSFYPEELVGRKVERLYVCQWCFKYSKELMGYLGHLVCNCTRRTEDPPMRQLTRASRKPAHCAPHPRPAHISTSKTGTRSMRSMARSTNSTRRISRSLPNCSSTPNPSSTTSPRSCTTCSSHTTLRPASKTLISMATRRGRRARSSASLAKRR